MTNVSHLNVSYDFKDIEEAFPDVDGGHLPLGHRVIVQVRTAKQKTAGGVLLPADSRDTEQWNTQIGVVRHIGPGAFKDRKTQTQWPEGPWCAEGDFIRVPKHGGDRWQVPIPGRPQEFAIFAIFNDIDLIAKVSNPLTVKSFV